MQTVIAPKAFEKIFTVSLRLSSLYVLLRPQGIPVEYLQRVKVEVAKNTLEKGRISIFEVMNEVGYSDDKAFREVFKKITGLSPLDYRGTYNRTAVWFRIDYQFDHGEWSKEIEKQF